jgi:hypothetical protein
MNVDSLTLYAYADKSQLHERELWRGFLLMLLPVLLEVDGSELAEAFDEATIDDAERLMETAGTLTNVGSLVRVISGTLALALGLPAEFGLAAFLESNPPTRIHAPRLKQLKLTDDELMSRWLLRFTRIRADDDFLEMAADWKDRLEGFFKGMHPAREGDGGQRDDASPLPDAPGGGVSPGGKGRAGEPSKKGNKKRAAPRGTDVSEEADLGQEGVLAVSPPVKPRRSRSLPKKSA